MALLVGIFDRDIIEAALGQKNTNTFRRDCEPMSSGDQRAKLVQGWADLIDLFTWRQRPVTPAAAKG